MHLENVESCHVSGCPEKILGWHVCRTKLARNNFIEARNVSRKMFRNFPRIFRAFICGPEKKRKFPAKFPSPKSKKNHRRASAGTQGEKKNPHFPWWPNLGRPQNALLMFSCIQLTVSGTLPKQYFPDNMSWTVFRDAWVYVCQRLRIRGTWSGFF